jgi:hypothetical protein
MDAWKSDFSFGRSSSTFDLIFARRSAPLSGASSRATLAPNVKPAKKIKISFFNLTLLFLVRPDVFEIASGLVDNSHADG